LPPIQTTNGNTTSTNLASEVHNSFYFNLSGVSPSSPADFSNSWGTGESIGLAYGLGLNKVTSIVFSGQFSTFPLTLTYPGVTFTGGGIHTLTFLFNGRFAFSNGNPVNFYIITGIGPSEFISDPLTGTNNTTGKTATSNATSISEKDFALSLGIGIDIRLAKSIALYIESTGVDTFVSQKVATEGYLTNGMFSLGMKFDN
jgi:opacity protein-like surface antigen